jgi:hypothetical protein
MDDPIRDLLAGLPQASSIPHPPGTIAVAREGVVTAGADPDAVDAWVAEHGGAVRRTAPVSSHGVGRGRMAQRTTPGVLYYVLPRDAL